jgi:hypothetical protein
MNIYDIVICKCSQFRILNSPMPSAVFKAVTFQMTTFSVYSFARYKIFRLRYFAFLSVGKFFLAASQTYSNILISHSKIAANSMFLEIGESQIGRSEGTVYNVPCMCLTT